MSLLGKIFKSEDNNKNIFVQIASYRDPEVVPTVRDLLSNSNNPKNLRICIVNQFSDEDNFNLDEFRNDSRFNIIDIPYHTSKGVCWARNLLNQNYSGEKYTLQIDSHHRFIKGWDTELIDMLEGLVSDHVKKPLLTAYVPSYNPTNDPDERVQVPWQLNFDKFIPEGAVFTLPAEMANRSVPRRTQFFSGHFVFTFGEFCKEVPYDPNLYFHGEEITMAVRAFTNGYDMFSPHKVILWHEYTREGRVKQWDDDTEWHLKNDFSHDRVRKILGIDGKVCSPCMQKSFGIYYLGKERSKSDYEQFAGLHFETRGATYNTLNYHEPSIVKVKHYYKQFYQTQQWKIKMHKDVLQGHLEFDFWAIILLDDQGVEIHRQDIDSSTIELILSDKNEILDLNGQYQGRPWSKWVVWPHKGEWLNKIEGIKI